MLRPHSQRIGAEHAVLHRQRIGGAKQRAAGLAVYQRAGAVRRRQVELVLQVLELSAQRAAVRDRQQGSRGGLIVTVGSERIVAVLWP